DGIRGFHVTGVQTCALPIWWERAPGRLREAVGAGYNLYSNLERPVPVRAADGAGLDLPDGAAATAWMDELVLEGATPLAYYDHRSEARRVGQGSRSSGSPQR